MLRIHEAAPAPPAGAFNEDPQDSDLEQDAEDLAQQFQDLVRARMAGAGAAGEGAGAEQDAERSSRRKGGGRQAPRQRRSTSIFNESTVWFGNTPIVYRTDTAVRGSGSHGPVLAITTTSVHRHAD